MKNPVTNRPLILRQTQVIIIVSLFFVLFDNYTFFCELIHTYTLEGKNLFYLATAPLLMFTVHLIFFSLLSTRWTIKPLIILVLVISSLVAYFMDSYHIVVDRGMIHNVIETDIHEALGLFNSRQLLYLLFLGLIPSWFVYKIQIKKQTLVAELKERAKLWGFSLLILLFLGWSAGNFYASLFKEHRILRDYTNPYSWIKSSISYGKHALRRSGPLVVKPIGLDATVLPKKNEKATLLIFIVGEALRSDHFGLNGYQRQTTPELSKIDDIVNFPEFYSCGTYTVYSVPCMFSRYDRSSFSREKERETENIMDLLAHTGEVSLLWRDNNSDPKKVMDRLGYEDYRSSKNNTLCEGSECRDIGMLKGLDQFVENNISKSKLVVLHIMGNHGPEYYKRYPKAFEKFTPVCRSNLLEECSKEEITNAYDNIILYTDTFLKRTIDFLKQYEKEYNVALIYISDHGESLGENGLYLHGMPYIVAPKAQKHVAAFAWFGEPFKNIRISKLKEKADKPYSHDNIFSTLLGIFDFNTSLYDPHKDIFRED